MRKTKRLEPRPAPNIKKYDQYIQDKSVRNAIVEMEYWPEYRSPKINTGRLQTLIFGGITRDVYNGLRRDEYLIKNYNLGTISFGNWVKNEDRMNYLAILAVSLYDLSNILKTKNLGKNSLTLDWGGVGQGRYKGVFFRDYDMISMPRYQRPDKWLKMMESFGIYIDRKKYFDTVSVSNRGELLTLTKAGKAHLMRTTSGWGSFAHEFGHWMDHVLGMVNKDSNGFVTGDKVLPKFDPDKQSIVFTEADIVAMLFSGKRYGVSASQLNRIERAFFDWLVAMYFQKTKTGYKANGQYKRLLKLIPKESKWKYWGSIIEVWARTFEIYVSEALAKKGIKNTFLVSGYKKFGRDIRIIDGKPVVMTFGNAVYPSAAHIWANRKVFENIVAIFATL